MALHEILGCGDSNCILQVGEIKGLRTHGGCNCLDGIPTKQRLSIERTIYTLRQLARCHSDNISDRLAAGRAYFARIDANLGIDSTTKTK